MEYSKAATILAKKCFLSPNMEEVFAIFDLNLPIDWFASTTFYKSLIEVALSCIKQTPAAQKCWDVFFKQESVSPWSNMPTSQTNYIEAATICGNWSMLSRMLEKSPGTKKEWDKLKTSPTLQAWSLGASYDKKQAEQYFPLISSDIETYRAENLWVLSATPKQLENSGVVWTPEKQKIWLMRVFSSCGKHESVSNLRKKSWELDVVAHDHHWKKWSEKDWVNVWQASPPGALTCVWSEGQKNETAYFSFLRGYKPSSSSPELYDILKKEASAFFDLSFSYATNKNTGKIKKILTEWNDVLLSSPNPELTSKGALIQSMMDFASSPTKLSSDTISLFSKSLSPSSFQDFSRYISSFLDDCIPQAKQFEARAYLTMSYIKAHASNLPKNFVSDFLDAEISRKNKMNIFVPLVGHSFRLISTSSDLEEQRLYAEVFWRSIFYMPSPNQNYWFKKAGKEASLTSQSVINFWNNDFVAKLDQVAERTRTPEIAAIVSKMSILSAISTVAEVQEKSAMPKSPRKL